MIPFKLPVILSCLLLSLLSTSVYASTSDAEFANIVQAERARARAQQAFDKSRRSMGDAERQDYEDYLHQLAQRVQARCTAASPDAAAIQRLKLPCDTLPAPLILSPVDRQAERLEEQRKGQTDAELDESFGEFDELLLSEQEKLEHARSHRSEESGGGGGGNDGDGTAGGDEGQGQGQGQGKSGTQTADGSQGDSQKSGKGGQTGKSKDQKKGAKDGTGQRKGQNKQGTQTGKTGSGQTGTTSDGTKTKQGSTQTGNQTGVPSDIPDGRDDDIIARQLREIAEKETDPKLRARLWEEYRRYKAGS